jgi:signal transduction histidine kinase/CheY-like chemotaxis protein
MDQAKTERAMEDKIEEIRRLQNCISNMVSLLALPAMWSGREPPDIVATLLDVLLSMLRLDFSCIRVSDLTGCVAEAVRVDSSARADQADEIKRLYGDWLTDDTAASPRLIPNPMGDGTVSIICFRLSLHQEMGALLAASARADFPTDVEALLLRVAANQAAIALREAMHTVERKRAEEKLREQTDIVQTINRIGRVLSAELDLKKLVQAVTDAATELSGARFGSFFYNVLDESGASYMLYTLSGVPIEHFSNFPMPRATDLFGPTFRGEGTILIDDVKKDPRYGKNSPYFGMPSGHLPVTSYLAVPVISRTGEVLGGLFFGHPEPGIFKERHARIIEGLAAQAAIAMDNAQLYRDAQEASRAKDEFLAVVSHELRTPLNAILGWSRMLRASKLDEATHERALETIERNAKAQSQLINDLLDVSRIISGKLRLELRPIDLGSVIKTALQTARPSVDAKDLRLEVMLDPGAGLVSGDPDRLQQVVWNLLSNAVRFTPRGGRVQVRLERINSHVEMIVSDTGVGISPEFLPFVFDRFRQADSSYTRKHGGLGLGLAIVRHLIEMHGGTVHVYSAGEGQGTTFTVKVPLMIVEDPARFQSETAERRHSAAGYNAPFEIAPILNGLRVLVVDDEPDARELLTTVLEKHDAAVTAVASVAEALDVFERLKPDALVSDIEMPNEDGYSLIRKVRSMKTELGGRIPAIALTAHARVEDRLRALSAGYQSHVAKPVEPAELIAVIASLVGRSGKH